ncbi:hypothetical protein NIES2111_00600 [Nostoc sp. NIES-2111]|jgi:hypothetical protein|nr:hypothetical protein NIES2111_00600 [Nostoc sp. NIES-2111]
MKISYVKNNERINKSSDTDSTITNQEIKTSPDIAFMRYYLAKN